MKNIPIQTTSSDFTDERDGQKYRTVKIGGQTWMAENFNYSANDCAGAWNSIYGRLYDWVEAMTIAPEGWHLPSDVEWDELESFASQSQSKSKLHDGFIDSGSHLKAEGGWDFSDKIINRNTFGFSALPGGIIQDCGNEKTDFIGVEGYWWTSTEIERHEKAIYKKMDSRLNMTVWGAFSVRACMSVRLVKD